ncbi:MAG: hypothetical protein A4E26_00612 [Methanobacterium sp. PtaU1.Bin097]|nr:MAG: hypothetical protein A4E26_00612 [Methanobacterium sp. PtaU1.Bin097]
MMLLTMLLKYSLFDAEGYFQDDATSDESEVLLQTIPVESTTIPKPALILLL